MGVFTPKKSAVKGKATEGVKKSPKVKKDVKEATSAATAEQPKKLKESKTAGKKTAGNKKSAASEGKAVEAEKTVEVTIEQQSGDKVLVNYIQLEGFERLGFLHHFCKVKVAARKKILVVFSSKGSLEFVRSLFDLLEFPVEPVVVGSEQTQDSGLWFTTNERLSSIDLTRFTDMMQYEHISGVEQYSACLLSVCGQTSLPNFVLLLRDCEVRLLRDLSVTSKRMELKEIQTQKKAPWALLERTVFKLIEKKFDIAQAAHTGYTQFIKSYANSAPLYILKELDPTQVCRSFGLDVPPRLEVFTQAYKQ